MIGATSAAPSAGIASGESGSRPRADPSVCRVLHRPGAMSRAAGAAPIPACATVLPGRGSRGAQKARWDTNGTPPSLRSRNALTLQEPLRPAVERITVPRRRHFPGGPAPRHRPPDDLPRRPVVFAVLAGFGSFLPGLARRSCPARWAFSLIARYPSSPERPSLRSQGPPRGVGQGDAANGLTRGWTT